MHILRLLPLAALLLLALAGCATAQRGAMIRAREAVQQERYTAALARLSDAENYTAPKPAVHAEIYYLRGLSHEGLGQPADAIGIYKYLIENFPDSIDAFKARERLKLLE